MSVLPPQINTQLTNVDGSLTLGGLRFLQSITDALNGVTVGSVTKTTLAGVNIYVGAGSPNGVVSDSPPSIYLNTSAGSGTTLYIKQSGTNTNTGWVGK